MSILEELEIYGYSRIAEQAILASMLLGEPALLIGPPGVAKTEVVAAIGAAMREYSKSLGALPEKQFSYQIYDASKLNFEDLMGYPDINGMKADPPVVRYIPTKSTIWNKHMIAFDELNRCVVDRQSNLFEIIRSRKLHGIPTNNLFIFGTMNPFGDQGTVEASDALIDRFLYYITVDQFSEMDPSERLSVIQRRGPVDSVGISHWTGTASKFHTDDNSINPTLATVGEKIDSLMRNAARVMVELQHNIANPVAELISKIVELFAKEFKDVNKQELRISGRRAAAMMRGVLGIRAIQMVSTDKNSLVEMTTTLIDSLTLALPIGIAGKLDKQQLDKASNIIETTVVSTWPMLSKNSKTAEYDQVVTATYSEDPIVILNTLLSQKMAPIIRDKVFARLLDRERYFIPALSSYDDQSYRNMKILLHMTNSRLKDFIPSHLEVKVSAEEIQEAQNATSIAVPPGAVRKFLRIINSHIASLKDNPLCYYAYRVGLEYVGKQVVNDTDMLKHLTDLSNMVFSLEDMITNYDKSTSKV